ncbi:hypothetical protein Hypma_006723 [Hypsizygus marmoreus]|uniref:Uncharacterized protein n=1 Tax=Hypsizygus marmoreus TaxID=39966 RepID=A0A369K2J8_HYPMA|nr:hypothetical protein Hypma_006723 [Hypsizygus marmoreus]
MGTTTVVLSFKAFDQQETTNKTTNLATKHLTLISAWRGWHHLHIHTALQLDHNQWLVQEPCPNRDTSGARRFGLWMHSTSHFLPGQVKLAYLPLGAEH